MYKYISFIIILISITIITETYSEENYIFVYSKSGLYLREKPTVNSRIITLIPNKSKLLLIEESNKVELVEESKKVENVDGICGCWNKVIYHKSEGWVFGGFLSKSKEDLSINDIYYKKSKNEILNNIKILFGKNTLNKSGFVEEINFPNKQSGWGIKIQTFTENDYLNETGYESNSWTENLKKQKKEFHSYKNATSGMNDHYSLQLFKNNIGYTIISNGAYKFEKIDPWDFIPSGNCVFEYITFKNNIKINISLSLFYPEKEYVINNNGKLCLTKKGLDVVKLFEQEVFSLYKEIDDLIK